MASIHLALLPDWKQQHSPCDYLILPLIPWKAECGLLKHRQILEIITTSNKEGETGADFYMPEAFVRIHQHYYCCMCPIAGTA